MLPPRAYVFLGLNAVRVLSIVALLLVFASSILVMVEDIRAVNRFIAAGGQKSIGADGTDQMVNCDYIEGSTVPNQPAGVFWAVLNRLLIIGQVIVLLLSEIGWPMAFFERFFPVLGKGFGLGALGIIQCLIGAAVLSHHVDDFALVAAFFLFSLGCLNILVGLIWRESAKAKRSITSWREQAKGVLPTSVASKFDVSRPSFSPPSFVSNLTGGSTEKAREADSESIAREKPGYGFGRQGEKQAGLKGFLITKPLETLPRYAPKPGGGSASRASSPAFSSSNTAV